MVNENGVVGLGVPAGATANRGGAVDKTKYKKPNLKIRYQKIQNRFQKEVNRL